MGNTLGNTRRASERGRMTSPSCTAIPDERESGAALICNFGRSLLNILAFQFLISLRARARGHFTSLSLLPYMASSLVSTRLPSSSPSLLTPDSFALSSALTDRLCRNAAAARALSSLFIVDNCHSCDDNLGWNKTCFGQKRREDPFSRGQAQRGRSTKPRSQKERETEIVMKLGNTS